MAKFRKRPVVVEAVQIAEPMTIETPEGTMRGEPGDWLITGVKGEKYLCKDDIFRQTYEPVGEEDTATMPDDAVTRKAKELQADHVAAGGYISFTEAKAIVSHSHDAKRDDALAKAAYYAIPCKHRPSWDNLAEVAKEKWRNAARAVLEAAGVEVLQTDEDEDSLPMAAFRLLQRRVGDRYRVRVYAGPDREHLDFAGELLLRPDEWSKLHLMLGLAAPEVGPIYLCISNDEAEQSDAALQRAEGDNRDEQ